ncbi:MAG: aminopeptidase [Lachnospiraceae bacterium]|nr:aminopeptidase [Lachnospiraceae bacterium]
MLERLQLSLDRMKEIKAEKKLQKEYQDYFEKVVEFLLQIEENRQWILAGNLQTASMEELEIRNRKLYQDILPENYEKSYANPQYAVKIFGKEMGQFLAAVYAELRSLIVASYENDVTSMVIRMELFLELYGMFIDACEEIPADAEESKVVCTGNLPDYASLKETYFWFACDYIEDILEKEVTAQFEPKDNWAGKLMDNTDISDLRYLYYYGEYVTENEKKLAEYMNSLPEEKIALMADTYTEGYRRGFEATQKDISIKKTVNVYYVLGMERMVKKAMANFRAIGLEPILYRAPVSFLAGRRLYKSGYSGANANKQFEYDHEYDSALYLNSKFVARKLEAYKAALELKKTECGVMGGPAVIEEFGEEPFVPVPKKENLKLDEHKQKLQVEYQSKARELVNRYVKGEERSFTIIAFPTPAIGEKFVEVFDETIKLNTLDNKLYTRCQQTIIDALDTAEYVRIKGSGKNHTDLKVAMWKLENPATQTNFENCVADVNIPVGEVFTSPKLTGTNGVLHVPKVFLHGLEYRDLEITFEDGMIADYNCKNFEEEAENKKFIKEKLLANRDTLPLGEFAIGTNTTAYVAAKRLEIEEVLPILIAEKTGPHFAIGDTCYSMEEDVVSFNPNGKQIMAKENEMSALRKTDMSKAYFQCHTDITIPYDELLELTAVEENGKETVIIQNGRFVLEGVEELNKAFEN